MTNNLWRLKNTEIIRSEQNNFIELKDTQIMAIKRYLSRIKIGKINKKKHIHHQCRRPSIFSFYHQNHRKYYQNEQANPKLKLA